MDNDKKLFDELLKADGIDPIGPTEAERNAFAKLLDQQSKIKHSKLGSAQPNIWRIIMNSKITKFAAAAVIIMAVGLSITLLITTIPSAYAIEQTIEAYNSIRWLHIIQSNSASYKTKAGEIWLKCDQQGNVTGSRYETDHAGDSIGPLILVGNLGIQDAWLPRYNLHLADNTDPGILVGFDVSELDPKFLIEKLLAQQERDEVIVDIDEPLEKAKPITVSVTYPEGSLSQDYKKVFYIDQATKLVTRIDKFKLQDQKFQLSRTKKFLDYNKPIDERMFTLQGDVSDDAQVIDMSNIQAGLPQGDMTDEQIALEVTTQFFQATIDKDFDKAGRLFLGAPGFFIENIFAGFNILEITSVGQASPHPDPDSDAMICSCNVLAESGGQYYEVNSKWIQVTGYGEDEKSWRITGNSTTTSPASGPITLSTDGADLSAATYDGLQTGELMQKWLLLEPIRIEVRGDTLFPSEKTQEDEFKEDQLDVTRFEPQVTIDEKDYQWLVLENEYGTIDLTSKYEDWYLITYAWAQIDMPEEKKGVLGIGSDDGVKVWLNGKLVHKNWTIRGVGYDNDRVPVTFKKGTNQLVLKIQNGGGPWGFSCRLMDE